MNPTRADYLFSTPGFISGMGSVMNIFGEYFLYNYAPSDSVDAVALGADWRAVGKDIRDATSQWAGDHHLDEVLAG